MNLRPQVQCWLAREEEEGPAMESRTGMDTRAWKRPTETSSIIIWRKFYFNHLLHGDGGRHLEEQVDEEDLSIDKDDGGQEGGQGTVEDVGAGPDENFLLTEVKKQNNSDVIRNIKEVLLSSKPCKGGGHPG